MKEINSLYKNSASTRPRMPARTWNVFWLKSSLILNLLYFENIPIPVKTTKVFAIGDSPNTYVKMMFFQYFLNMIYNIARALARVHLKIILINTLINLNIFCFETMSISLKTTKMFTIVDTPKNHEKMMIFKKSLKYYVKYSARTCPRALKMFPDRYFDWFWTFFVLKSCPYLLKQRIYSQS